jgi:hypothetical protein
VTFAISFQFQDTTLDLAIQPIQHPAVQSWMDTFVSKGTKYHANLQDWSMIRAWQPAVMKAHLETLKHALAQLTAFGINFAGEIPTSSLQLNRQFLNVCHRFFTENQKNVNADQNLCERYGSDCEKKVNAILSEINRCVHELELYMPAARDHQLKSFVEIHIEYDSYNNQWSNPQWWHMQESWRDLHTTADQHFDVLLTSEILGKTILKSYLDDDDPHHWDTSGHYDSLGGLQIQFGPYRKSVYQSQDFQDWYGRPTTDAFYDYPIGNVVDRDQLMLLSDLLDKSRYYALSVPVYYHHC